MRVRAIRTLIAVVIAPVVVGCTIGSPSSPESVDPTTAPPTSSEPTPAATPTDTLEPAAAPVVGECRYVPDGGFGRISDLSRVTACDDEHTAETVWVGEATGPEAEESTPDWEAITRDIPCFAHLTEYLGSGDWMATRLTTTAFVAPIGEWRLGARWVRCDVFLPEFGADGYRHGDALDAPVALNAEAISALHACLTFDPDEPELAQTVDCAEPHNRELIAPTVDLTSLGEDFPDETQLAELAEEQCPDTILDFVGGDPQALVFAWSGPDEETWDLGARVLVCHVEVIDGRMAGSAQGAGEEVAVIPFAAGEDDPAIDPYDLEDPLP